MADPSSPVAPRPAASVLLVRPGTACPVEVYMIRRQESMRFLGGFYAFPGGKVVWAAHRDGRHKFHGILDRIETAGFSIPRSKRAGQT